MDPSLGTPSVRGDPGSAYPIDDVVVDGAPSCFARDDTSFRFVVTGGS
jgi:hypothetical protein